VRKVAETEGRVGCGQLFMRNADGSCIQRAAAILFRDLLIARMVSERGPIVVLRVWVIMSYQVEGYCYANDAEFRSKLAE
jgi:hypothetical protein